MFGYLRFFLAFLVLLSHIGVKFYGLNPGVIAVVIFYILAGFVVSHLYEDILVNTKYKIFSFYKDRFLRIFPLYLYICFLTTIFVLYTSYGNPDFTFFKTISNLMIIPLNYYMYIDFTILTKPSWALVPPAWSLGTELQAYILLSIIFIFKRYKIYIAFASFIVYIVANLSIINPDYFGYRLVAGVLYMFFIGSYIQKKEYYFPLLIWLAILILIPIFYITDLFSPTYTKETFIGLLLGIPLVYIISKSKIKLYLNSFLGSLSYGIFLSHFLSIWILEYFSFKSTHTVGYISVLTLLSLFISYVGVVFIEKNIKKMRNIEKY